MMVECQEKRWISVEMCALCIHSQEFQIDDDWITSPARAYCPRCTVTERPDLTLVTEVRCADWRGDGFQSITNLIS